VDSNNLPKRFKLKITVESLPTEYSKLNPGDSFINAANYSAGTIIHGKPFKTNPYTDSTSSGERDMSTVTCYRIKVEDDINDPGGFSPGNPRDLLDGYKGNIISKTQKWDGKWSSKKKMKEFYLDWGEKPNLWPVGPVDLRWDSSRKVWTTGGSGGVSYKMVYATLEEDLVREDDFIETYPARGFLDDIEYSKDNLPLNYRRLIYIKDRSGFTAPRGVKLLCRYDSDSGFYEPISKPTIITTGRIDTGNQAIIDMTYVQGRQSGQIPQTIITFDNKFGFPITTGKIGLFTYVGGKWILTTIQQN
jgi:hypothetical protein